MAEWRKIHTKFWSDPEWLDFTPEDKFFYLCLLTNPKTTACGVYEVHLKELAMWTGYNTETIEKLLEHFIRLGKVDYDEKTHEVFIKNWFRYNLSSSPKILTLIHQEIQNIKSQRFAVAVIENLQKLGYLQEKQLTRLKSCAEIPHIDNSDTVSRQTDTVSGASDTVSSQRDTVSNQSDTVSKKSAGDIDIDKEIEIDRDSKTREKEIDKDLKSISQARVQKKRVEVPVEYARPVTDAWQAIHRLPDGTDPLTDGDYATVQKVIRELWKGSVSLEDVLGTISAIGELKRLDPHWAIAKPFSILKHISSYRDGTLKRHIESLKRKRPHQEVLHAANPSADFRRRTPS